MKLTNELRLGNLVSTKYMGMIVSVVVDSISRSGINLVGGDSNGVYNTYDLDEISPIELTEEWLLRLGFKYYATTECWSYHIHFRLGFKLLDGDIVMYVDDNFWSKIKYVHQLQNLYFCLTGEELTLNN